jgi:hypothetical protein
MTFPAGHVAVAIAVVLPTMNGLLSVVVVPVTS